MGSNRPGRICPSIAGWIQKTLQDCVESSTSSVPVHYEVLDLAEVQLPFLDEPLIPALGQYEHEHTKMWSRTVSGYDGFVFVFPQYNWGYPALPKNALDFLYREWSGKPASYATYGGHGGNRAAAQFQSVLAGLHMRELFGHLEIVIGIDDLDGNWQLKDPEASLAPYRRQLHGIARQMHRALGIRVHGHAEPVQWVQAGVVAARRFGVRIGVLPRPRLRQRPRNSRS